MLPGRVEHAVGRPCQSPDQTVLSLLLIWPCFAGSFNDLSDEINGHPNHIAPADFILLER